MKKLILVAAMLSTVTAFGAGTIKCAKTKGGFLRPVDAKAIEVTKRYGVKTCDRSPRLKAALKKAGVKIEIVKPTKEMIETYGVNKSKQDANLDGLF